MDLLEVPVFDNDVYKMLFRLSVNLVVMFALLKFCYSRHQNDRDYFFSFLLINILIFFICFTLKKLDLGLGMALGLFAVFSVMRFRTDAMPVKEMTYLFLVIGVAVINALSNKKTSYLELMLSNLIIVTATYLMERTFDAVKNGTKLGTCDLVYDRMDMLRPDRADELHQDLEQRTGLEIERVNLKKVDLSKGTASITIRYREA